MFKKITLTLGVLALITATATKTAVGSAKSVNQVRIACAPKTIAEDGDVKDLVTTYASSANAVAFGTDADGNNSRCYALLINEGSAPSIATIRKLSGRSKCTHAEPYDYCSSALKPNAGHAVIFNNPDSPEAKAFTNLMNNGSYNSSAMTSNWDSSDTRSGVAAIDMLKGE